MICVYNRDFVTARGQEHRLDSPMQVALIARHIAWQAVFQEIDFQMVDEGLYGPFFRNELLQAHLAADLLLSEAADYECLIGKNARANSQLSFRSGLALENQWKGLPAVIVGAGPSLKENIPFLKTLQDKALILAGGSAVDLLGFKPHFVAAIDKYKPVTSFPEVPLLTQLRAHPDGWASHEERIVFPDSSSSWLNGVLGEKAFDSGWTVANFLVAVAHWAGCDPVILVGTDFCKADGSTQKDWVMAAEWMRSRGLSHKKLEEMVWGQFQSPSIAALPMRRVEREVVVNDVLLESLWTVWRPVFEREGGDLELHKRLFFQRVREEHAAS